MTYTFKLSRRLATSRLVPAASLILLAACGGDAATGLSPDQPADATNATVVISPKRLTAETHQPTRFTAFGLAPDGDSLALSDIEWTASGGSITPDGVFSASDPGTYQLVALNRYGKGKKADTSTVVVIPPTPSLASVIVSPDTATLAPGATRTFNATGKLSDGSATAVAVTWTATGGSIDAGGVYTAGSTAGTYLVIARQTSGTLADTARVTIQTAAPAPSPTPTPTLQSVVLSPASVSLATGATQQFSASGKMSDGSSTSVAVTYAATGGTVSSSGLYTAGSTAGTYRVIATAGGKADTSSVTVAASSTPPSSSATPWLVENYSRYATISDYLQTSSTGWYRTSGSNPSRQVFDAAQGFGGSPHALRYDFPAGDPANGGCNDYSIGRELTLPSAQTELWIEFYVKFQQGWHTEAPSTWGCTRAADHKLLRGYVGGVSSYNYFSIKDGHFGWAWVSSAPDPNHWDQNAADVRPYWNGQWIRMRAHWKVGQAPNYGVVEVWANDQLIDRYTTVDTPAGGIYMLRIGANMNNLVEAPQSMWWGQIKVWNTNPGW